MSIEINHWKPLDKDLFTSDVLRMSIDTRDFCCIVNKDEMPEVKDLKTLMKYKQQFFFEIEEVYELMDRLKRESGGDKKWRMLSFSENGHWFKYIRIYKTEFEGKYLVGTDGGDKDTRFFKRQFWFDAKVNQDI